MTTAHQPAAPFSFAVHATEGHARAGTLTLPHGTVQTPAFMPVGTHGAVRGLHPEEVTRTGAQIILGNTYHLHVRPGEEVIRTLGGLHRFSTWQRPMLTDSGGFQVFSLDGFRQIEEHGVSFVSHLDGTRLLITPERSMEIQHALGADIAMAFDHVVPGQAAHALAEEGMERTLRWLDRCRARHEELGCATQTMWPIVQGGTHHDLRKRSLEGILARGPWTGVAIGGLSVGEEKPVMHEVLDALAPSLPTGVPRYLMGVGFPDDLLEGIARGVDLFDCVAATRNGRHGSAWTHTGKLSIGAVPNKLSDAPIDAECDCNTCSRFSRGYIRHLLAVKEDLGPRLVSVHNIRFLVRLGEQARAAILDGTFTAFRRAWRERYFASRGEG